MGKSRSLLLSILLHLFIISFFLISFNTDVKTPTLHLSHTQQIKKQVEPIVQATAVNQQQVNQEIQKLKNQKIAKQQAEQNRINKLNQLAQQAKQNRLNEQRRLAQLKAKQIRAEKLAQQKLLALKKRQRAEQKRIADLKRKQKLAQQKAARVAAKKKVERLAKARAAKRAANLAAKRKAEKLAAEKLAAQKAAQARAMRGVISRYQALILRSISENWLVPANTNKHLASQLLIRLAPGGKVLNVRLTKSSGDPALDRSAIAAVYKASPLPVPTDAQEFNLFRQLRLTVRPEQIITS